LLDHLQDIETQQGRVRSVPNAARTLDLDIIDMDALCQTAERLVLPHPRAHERAFVLYPLRDVQPGWVHPRTGQPLEQMLQAVEGQEIRVIG
jgi:2-amino-4-hydroxy-6-hydroxymethyldihydropteridine diphosphokinase